MAENMAKKISLQNGGAQWKYLATITGIDDIILPAKFEELFVVVTVHSSSTEMVKVTLQIPRISLRNDGETQRDWYVFGSGYYSDGAQVVSASAYISKAKYSFYNANYLGTAKTNTAISEIYYR